MPVTSEGKRSGVNWIGVRPKLERERVGDGFHRRRLGQTGNAFEQHMATGQDADDDTFHHVFLPDDDATDLGRQLIDEYRFFLYQLRKRLNFS